MPLLVSLAPCNGLLYHYHYSRCEKGVGVFGTCMDLCVVPEVVGWSIGDANQCREVMPVKVEQSEN